MISQTLKQPKPTTAEARLRRRAEARLRDERQRGRAKGGGQKPDADTARLVQELEVHQIELEMQNAELGEAREKTEALLEKYTDLYDFAPVGYFSLDEKGLILEVNLRGATLLDVERGLLIKRHLRRFVAPGSQPAFEAFLERIFAGLGDQACEVALLRKGGATFWASLHGASAISLTPGKWCRVMVSDITRLKQAEELLRRNEALFSTLIEQAPVGVYVVDAQLRLQQVNPKARPVFSTIHPLNGRDIFEILHILWGEKSANEITGHFRHTLKTGQAYYSADFSERRRDTGVNESYEWQVQRITLPGGDHGVVCFFTNITERKRADENRKRVEILAASNQKLEREIVRRRAMEVSLRKSEQNQRKLLKQSRDMAERLRRLSRLILSAQEEERKKISRELHDVIAQTLTGINVRLANLKKEAMNNVRGIGRRITLTQRLVRQSVEVVHRFARELRPSVLDDLGLIPALHTFMKNFTAQTGIRVSLSAFASVEEVNGDKRTVLYRVAQEALTNVARHAQASKAEVKIQQLNGALCMTIIDDGKGFQKKRGPGGKKAERLGLLGMKERLEMLDGTLNVESGPGKGTKVCAQIPLANVAGAGNGSQPRTVVGARRKGSRK